MRRQNLVLIGDLLREFTAQKPIDEGLMRCRVFDAWDALVAERTGNTPEEAAALTLRKFYKDRTLTCKMASSMVRMHFQMQMDQLLPLLNARLPEPAVDKIVLQ